MKSPPTQAGASQQAPIISPELEQALSAPPPGETQTQTQPPPDHHAAHYNQQPPQHHPPHPPPPQTIGAMYASLVFAICRPPKMRYEFPRGLGPSPLTLSDGTVTHREDFIVTNNRGHRLGCSIWKPTGTPSQGWPCVIYLHGNSSSRAEAVKTNVIKSVVAAGSVLVSFDFSGCGNNEQGQYISLGWFEGLDDTRCVVEEMRRRGCGAFTLWGRSMGAVSALLFAITIAEEEKEKAKQQQKQQTQTSSSPSLPSPPSLLPAGLILDSPFSSFKNLAHDLTSKGLVHIPSALTHIVLSMIRRSVQHRANVDLFKVNPLGRLSSHTHTHTHTYLPNPLSACPALFIVAEEDELIPPWHCHQLKAKWPGPCLGLRMEGSHNSSRPSGVFALCGLFVKGVNERSGLVGGVELMLRLVEKTAVVMSQQEEEEMEEEEEGHGYYEEEGEREEHHHHHHHHHRRRRRRHRGPYSYYYEDADGHTHTHSHSHSHSHSPTRHNKSKSKNKKKKEGGIDPSFIHTAGPHLVINIQSTTKTLIHTLDVNLAARAVEEYLLDEMVAVGVSVVQTQVQAVQLSDGAASATSATAPHTHTHTHTGTGGLLKGKEGVEEGMSVVVPKVSETKVLDEVARTQAEIAAAYAVLREGGSGGGGGGGGGGGMKSKTTSNKKKVTSAAGLYTTWEEVIYAEGREQWNETQRIFHGLQRVYRNMQYPSPVGGLVVGGGAPVLPLPSSSSISGRERRQQQQQQQRQQQHTHTHTQPLATLLGTKLCCFDPQDAYLSESQGREARLAQIAETFFSSP